MRVREDGRDCQLPRGVRSTGALLLSFLQRVQQPRVLHHQQDRASAGWVTEQLEGHADCKDASCPWSMQSVRVLDNER